ncbi:threonine aldolase family protein [Pseudooceanicola atlanticus]|uniref:threonine aldolase family protein n=1 Tax=Pseudooceanicola atlanticus TaxID=1461694 RepID=UPI0023532863|nr:GntG family PLP-dependent aldolase [Pseudooceanicola atlanticus]
MKFLDFRSDTLTVPSDSMRARMAKASVGDDYYREDPTISAIEDYAADLLGKEAALFVLSGTMGNLVSIRAQVPPGAAVIVGNTSHIHLNETGHLASVCGLTSHPTPTPDGRYDIPALEASSPVPKPGASPSVLNPRLKLICVENTHNGEGGRCLDNTYLASLREFANVRGLTFHMDGARVFNAAVALGCKVSELVSHVDSVSFCLSKGLGAPGGAIVAASRHVIEEARHWRQMVGGGMRQAGIFAAAGLMALQENVEDLAIDHNNAKQLARGLVEAGLDVDVAKVETNIVMAYIPQSLTSPGEFFDSMKRAGVLTLPPKGNRLRFVIHRDISNADVMLGLQRIGQLTESFKKVQQNA